VPIFSAEQGKEEMLSVRTAILGVKAPGLSSDVSFPFPPGSELESFAYEAGVAKIKIGGAFRAEEALGGLGEWAAGTLALTVAQFGETATVDVTDAAGKVHYTGRADSALTADVGSPKSLGLLAIREDKDHPPSVLSVLFDRPVFVEEIAFYSPGRKSAYPGKAYSTGFGMTVELHPDHKSVFDAKSAYRVRMVVRDGKGRRSSDEREMHPKEVTRE
jgi:hypothetical protein